MPDSKIPSIHQAHPIVSVIAHSAHLSAAKPTRRKRKKKVHKPNFKNIHSRWICRITKCLRPLPADYATSSVERYITRTASLLYLSHLRLLACLHLPSLPSFLPPSLTDICSPYRSYPSKNQSNSPVHSVPPAHVQTDYSPSVHPSLPRSPPGPSAPGTAALHTASAACP